MCIAIEPQAPTVRYGRLRALTRPSRRPGKDVIVSADNTPKNRRLSSRAGAPGMPHCSLREILLCVAFSLPWADLAFAQHEHSSSDFEVFVATEPFHGTRQTGREDADPWVGADVVFGVTKHQFRVFGQS